MNTPCLIELTQGKVALVSPEDYAAFNAYRWHAAKCNGRFYARRSISRRGMSPLVVSMHREVPTVLGAKLVDHINGDSLDNRRENLRSATPSENAFNLQSGQFAGRTRCVFMQRGRYVVRVGDVYGGSFDNEPEAAYWANRLLDRLSPGAGHRNPLDKLALVATLQARRDQIDAVLLDLSGADRAA